jgi:orotidine-5'-phosphate decarboxylase
MTIHLSGGAKMIEAAVAGLGDSQAIVLGVTVLTSSNRETLREIAVESEVADQVLRLARLGVDAGLKGVVASPQEITMLRQAFGETLKIVTPGVRPQWAEANDQQRTMTPAEAMRAGANYLVIGRPITAQADPKAATRRILDELGEAAS